jgi:peroxiredoxin (alkyl hydroperoxide reductase subunit C)
MNENPPIAPSPGAVRIGDDPPNFVARSTEGMVELSRFRGRWLVLFAHPGDFTPACTSEFIALARSADAFAALGCDLLGHSVDSLFSHLAWIKAIHDELGVTVPFPVIEDPTLEIARAYGMVSAEMGTAATVRAAYFIDPRGIVRAITWYPLQVGRSVAEMLRLVAALQATDGSAEIAPEGWHPGEPLLGPPRFTTAEVLATRGPGQWFYRQAGNRP